MVYKLCKWLLATVLLVTSNVATYYLSDYCKGVTVLQELPAEISYSGRDYDAVIIVAIPELLATTDQEDEYFARKFIIGQEDQPWVCIQRGVMFRHKGFIFKLQSPAVGEVLAYNSSK